MTYKNIMNEIKRYERQYNLAHQEFYDGRKPGQNKIRKYDVEEAKMNAVFCALFDVEQAYESNYLPLKSLFIDQDRSLQNMISSKYDELFNKTMNDTFDENGESLINEIISLEEFKKVYMNFVKMAFKLSESDFLKLINYIKKTKEKSIAFHKKQTKIEEKKIVSKLLSDVKDNYKIFNENVSKTDKIVTKEEVYYKVLINAIFNSLEYDKISKEDVLKSFSSFEVIENDPGRSYYDKDVELAKKDAFNMYSDIFNKVYILGDKNKMKLRKKLENKMYKRAD